MHLSETHYYSDLKYCTKDAAHSANFNLHPIPKKTHSLSLHLHTYSQPHRLNLIKQTR